MLSPLIRDESDAVATNAVMLPQEGMSVGAPAGSLPNEVSSSSTSRFYVAAAKISSARIG